MAIDQLKVAFSILHEISEENRPEAKDYGLSEKQFTHIIENLIDKGYLKGVSIIRAAGGMIGCKFIDPRVTLDGLEYLHENSALMKTYRGLKEVKSWIPFLN